MKNLVKRIVRKVRKLIFPPDEASIRKRKARRKGLFLCLQREPYVYKIENIRSKFYLPYYRTDYIQQKIITENNYYEAGDLNYISKEWRNGIIGRSIKSGLILDVGANIGNHTLFFCNECEAEFVHCFEPIASTRKVLEKNIAINHLSQRVSIHPVAVGAASGRARISYYDKNNIGSTALTPEASGEILITSIDDLAFDKGIKLIKIDVEGFELEVIKGCMQTIRSNHPFIMIEIRDEFMAEIQTLLEPLSYKFERLSGINYLLYES